MNIREIQSSRNIRVEPATKTPPVKKKFFGLLSLVLIFFALFSLGHTHAHASANGDVIKSGFSGYCLDNYKGNDTSGNRVEIWGCNGSDAQSWSVGLTGIKFSSLCLEASSLTSLTIETCNSSPNQVWLEDGNDLYNPHYQKCLTATNASDGAQLVLSGCSQALSQKFSPSVNLEDLPCQGTQGQIVACNAVKEWIKWQANPSQRPVYLAAYTDNAAYEEWCADFVSYVYKVSGYPFSNGDPGWDENIAGNIASQGFTVEPASYVPQPGDVGYFDYPGGHVEIVIVGGSHPTFIYGDSDVKDPIINNGAMAANDLLAKKGLGSLQNYLIPTSST